MKRTFPLLALLSLAACSDSPTGGGNNEDCDTPLQLGVGQTATLSGASARTVCLDGQASGADFALVAFYGSEDQTASVNVNASSQGGVAVQGPPNPTRGGPVSPLFSRYASDPVEDREFHLRLMERAQRELSPRVEAARAAGGLKASRSVAAAPPAVGALLNLNVNANQACSNPQLRTARVRAVSQKAVVLEDTLNPKNGFTQADFEHIAATFDTLVHPVNVANFGEPQDIDANQRVLILYTKAVNELTPAGSGSYVGGFFYSRDLFPKTEKNNFQACSASNEGELFYMLSADPTGQVNGNARSREFVLRQTIATVAHEYQHLINASRRLYVVKAGGSNWNETVWLNEGLSHIAEELIFYRSSGLQPRQNISLAMLQQDQRRLTAANTYQIQNFGRFEEYLGSPNDYPPYGADDDLGTRGSAWAFLRYAADRKNGNDAQLWNSIVNRADTGLVNLRATVSNNIVDWVRDWTVSVYTDDAVAGVPAIYTQPSWNFRSIYEQISDGYPLQVRSLVQPTTVRIDAGGGAFFRLGAPSGAVARVELTTQGQAPPSPFSVTVVRTR